MNHQRNIKRTPPRIPRGPYFEHDSRFMRKMLSEKREGEEEENEMETMNEDVRKDSRCSSISSESSMGQNEMIEDGRPTSCSSTSSNKKENRGKKWTHDFYNSEEQKPKTKDDIIRKYGFNIRESVPDELEEIPEIDSVEQGRPINTSTSSFNSFKQSSNNNRRYRKKFYSKNNNNNNNNNKRNRNRNNNNNHHHPPHHHHHHHRTIDYVNTQKKENFINRNRNNNNNNNNNGYYLKNGFEHDKRSDPIRRDKSGKPYYMTNSEEYCQMDDEKCDLNGSSNEVNWMKEEMVKRENEKLKRVKDERQIEDNLENNNQNNGNCETYEKNDDVSYRQYGNINRFMTNDQNSYDPYQEYDDEYEDYQDEDDEEEEEEDDDDDNDGFHFVVNNTNQLNSSSINEEGVDDEQLKNEENDLSNSNQKEDDYYSEKNNDRLQDPSNNRYSLKILESNESEKEDNENDDGEINSDQHHLSNTNQMNNSQTNNSSNHHGHDQYHITSTLSNYLQELNLTSQNNLINHLSIINNNTANIANNLNNSNASNDLQHPIQHQHPIDMNGIGNNYVSDICHPNASIYGNVASWQSPLMNQMLHPNQSFSLIQDPLTNNVIQIQRPMYFNTPIPNQFNSYRSPQIVTQTESIKDHNDHNSIDSTVSSSCPPSTTVTSTLIDNHPNDNKSTTIGPSFILPPTHQPPPPLSQTQTVIRQSGRNIVCHEPSTINDAYLAQKLLSFNPCHDQTAAALQYHHLTPTIIQAPPQPAPPPSLQVMNPLQPK
ncbi:hypothetical protein SNEBB_007054 [Seison nebaliae]|nr:hypothetical protein SNEBB_007054 [Seison nebaliae]